MSPHWGRTALLMAASLGYRDIVRVLIGAGANQRHVDRMFTSAIHLAAMEGYHGCMAELIKSGSDINSKDIYKRTPLLCAINTGSPAIVKQLLEAGCNLEDKSSYSDLTPFLLASMYGELECVSLLLKYGCNKSAMNWDDHTALHFAVKGDHAGIVDLLIRNGLDIDACGPEGYTPLTLAASCGSLASVKRLLQAGWVLCPYLDSTTVSQQCISSAAKCNTSHTLHEL